MGEGPSVVTLLTALTATLQLSAGWRFAGEVATTLLGGVDPGDGELPAHLLDMDKNLVDGHEQIQESRIGHPKHHGHGRHVQVDDGAITQRQLGRGRARKPKARWRQGKVSFP